MSTVNRILVNRQWNNGHNLVVGICFTLPRTLTWSHAAAALDAAWKLLEASRSQLVVLPQDQEEAPLDGRPPVASKGSFTLQKRLSEADTPLMEGLDMTILSR